MKCKKAGYLISLFIDGELSDEEFRRLDEHLKTCSSCRKELDKARQISSAFRAAMPEEIKFDFLMPKISNGIARRRSIAQKPFDVILPFRRIAWSAAFTVIFAVAAAITLPRLIFFNNKNVHLKESPSDYTTLSAYLSDEEDFEDELIKIYYGVYAASNNKSENADI